MILKKISKSTSISEDYLVKISQTASHRYKRYFIPKRGKGKGMRVIDHPSKQVKLLQGWLVDNVFSYLPVHRSVFSYRKKLNIQNHAAVHVRSKFLLRVDFRDFFHSISGTDVRHLLNQNKKRLPFHLSQPDIAIIVSIVCKKDRLTIGAPSSPSISNAILYDFDRYWYKKCNQNKIFYTRYADDLYFSTIRKNCLQGLYEELREYLTTQKFPTLELNDEKTIFTTKKAKRIVTGLVITPSKKISIGRKKKRYIKGLVNRFKHQALDQKIVAYLKGYLAYVNSVEPSFISRLKKKFGKDLIGEIASLN